jgi:DNA-binding beta-propeller fold protein YncE
VWIGGSGATDDMLLKFTVAGRFVLQIGARGQSGGNDDQKNLGRPADAFVDAKAHEIYVADGYGNRRVIVFDSGTGAFKRMWGGMPAFSNPVHSITVSHDGLVYVADRANQRIQVFTPAGQYLKQMFVNRGVASAETVAGLAFSPDPEQRFLYAADYGNSRMVVIDRARLEVLYQFGRTGTGAGDFRSPHLIATDSKGNLYTAEVAPGNRAQKFTFKGLTASKPPNALP